MDFDLTDEQRLLKESAERLIAETYDFQARKRIAASPDGLSREVWRRFAELGWLAMPFAEEDGGLGGGPVEIMILMEALGAALVVEPYLPTVVLAGGLVQRLGTAEQRSLILPGLAGGEWMLALATAEPQGRFDLADVSTTARREGDGWRLDGRKAVVLGGPSADRILVSARTSGGRRDRRGVSLFLLDPTASGVERRDAPSVDRRGVSDLLLSDVRLPADAILGPIDEALPALEEAVDHGIAAVVAEGVGSMRWLLEATKAHLKTRRQFGRALGEFQALQHRLVDMLVQVEETHSLMLLATLSLGLPAVERRRACSLAKAKLGEAGRFVGGQAVQLHGGMGMTEELPVGHHYKRLVALDTLFGTTDHHLKLIADLNAGEPAEAASV